MEKLLSQELSNHVKFLIKTKLNQKWLAFPPLSNRWYRYYRGERAFNLRFGSSTGRTPGWRERKGWREWDLGPAGTPLDLAGQRFGNRNPSIWAKHGVFASLAFATSGGPAKAVGRRADCQRSRRPCSAKRLTVL